MRFLIPLLLAALVLPACAAPPGDAADDASSAAQAAFSATEVQTGRAFPQQVHARGRTLFWTEGRSLPVESGQTFRFAGEAFLSVDGGAAREVASFGDSVKDVLVAGDDIFFVRPSGIARSSLAALARGEAPTTIYDDARYEGASPPTNSGIPEGVSAAAFDGGRVYVIRKSGELASVTTDGRDFREHAKVDGEALGLVA